MQKNIFKSKRSFKPVTEEVASCVVTIEGQCIKLIDTPGLLDPCSIKTEEYLEFAKGLISIQSGFHAIGVVLNVCNNIEYDANLFINLLSTYKHYLPHIFIMFTHGIHLGKTNDEQNSALKEMLNDLPTSSYLYQILKEINYRYLIIESVNNMEQGYHSCKSKELLEAVQTIFRQTGMPATNEFASVTIAHNLELPRNELEQKLTEGIKVAVEKSKKHKKGKTKGSKRTTREEEAKTNKRTKSQHVLSSEEDSDFKNETEESSNSNNEEKETDTFYKLFEMAISKNKRVLFIDN